MNGSTPRLKRLGRWLWLAPLLALILLGGWVAWRQADLVQSLKAPSFTPPPGPAALAGADAVQRGAYLARAGHCAGCHTAPGGAAYAGGRALNTPFGAIWPGNLTPDPETGLGRWSADDFWAALHSGRSRDGRLLSPAFPYAWTAQLARSDVDDLYAFFRSLPPVAQATPAAHLSFPFNSQPALAVWQALYLNPARSAGPRGAYLVEGIGHCGACHAPRTALGAGQAGTALDGALLPDGRAYAPSLRRADEAGVGDWAEADVVALLRDGIAPSRPGAPRASGLMAEVVRGSTQFLHEEDLRAIAKHLQGLTPENPSRGQRPSAAAKPAAPADLELGQAVYEKHCADCHGSQGEGGRFGQPALAGNRAMGMDTAVNLIAAVLHGGYGASTAGHPRPQGMPPFAQTLTDAEVAAVLTLMRQRWGEAAGPVRPQEVAALR